MAKTISQADTPLRISLIFLGIGAVLGLAYFLVSLVLARYVVDPLACGIVGSASQCASSAVISDGITAILIAVGSVFIGVRYGVARPLLVAASVAVFMWGLTIWTGGLFWLEAAMWAIVLYALAYLVFGWINRHPVLGYVIVVTLLAIIVERIVLAL